MNVGEKIREARKEKSLTQKDLGKLIHKSSQVVSNWERGYTTGITPDDLSRISEKLGKPIDYFVDTSSMPSVKPATSFMELTDAERAHLELYRKLSDEAKKLIDDNTSLLAGQSSQPPVKEKAAPSPLLQSGGIESGERLRA